MHFEVPTAAHTTENLGHMVLLYMPETLTLEAQQSVWDVLPSDGVNSPRT